MIDFTYVHRVVNIPGAGFIQNIFFWGGECNFIKISVSFCQVELRYKESTLLLCCSLAICIAKCDDHQSHRPLWGGHGSSCAEKFLPSVTSLPCSTGSWDYVWRCIVPFATSCEYVIKDRRTSFN
jgi:hypothetical protein